MVKVIYMKYLEKISNAPIALKLVIGAVPVLIIAMWFISMQVNGYKYNQKFFNEPISSIVMNSNSYYGRSVEFHLKNGFTLYFLPPINDKIMIGDSVQKERKTYQYNVYRKNANGIFELFACYNFKNIP